MNGTFCPLCKDRFQGERCPTCAWDSRYGSVKRGCAMRDCTGVPKWRSVDRYNRPVEYHDLWCEIHRPQRGQFSPLEVARA